MINLANAYCRLGRFDDGLRLNEESLALTKAELGLDHSQTRMIMHNLSIVYHEVGRHVDGLKLRQELLAIVKTKLTRTLVNN